MSSAGEFAGLREAAEGATPGPWERRGRDPLADVVHCGTYVAQNALWRDAAYIAAANPAVVLALLDRLEAAEDEPQGDAGSNPERVCDHPGLDHGIGWNYCWTCPACGVCKFIGHGPLCLDCYAGNDDGESR